MEAESSKLNDSRLDGFDRLDGLDGAKKLKAQGSKRKAKPIEPIKLS
jgi:hypothetical protein